MEKKPNYYKALKHIINLSTHSFPPYFRMPNVWQAHDVSCMHSDEQYTIKTCTQITSDHLKLFQLECHFSPRPLPSVFCGIKLDTYNKKNILEFEVSPG